MKKDDWILSSVYTLAVFIFFTPLAVFVSMLGGGLVLFEEYVVVVFVWVLVAFFSQVFSSLVVLNISSEVKGKMKFFILVFLLLAIVGWFFTLPLFFVVFCMKMKYFQDKILRSLGVKAIYLLYGYVVVLVVFCGWVGY